jgi:SpoVK/Ycf46/Vps4 family AAA+-type ATPase
MSGTGSSNFSDGGTASRVFGTFVSWMQDKKPGVFVIATANDVTKLPAELLRKGRFDAIWFVDLPTIEERKEIFRTHIRRIYDKLLVKNRTEAISLLSRFQLLVDAA